MRLHELLGAHVRDTVSGFEGIVMGYTVYTTGCHNVAVAPTKLDDKGAPREWCWFDAERVSVINPGTYKRRQYDGPDEQLPPIKTDAPARVGGPHLPTAPSR